MTLFLASQSPRRKQLLASLNIPFEVLPPATGVDMEALEARRGKESPLAYVKRVTLAKLNQARGQITATDAVLCADTTVALGRDILGKPESAANNAAMLSQLQGQTHRVMTAVALWHSGNIYQTVCTSHVTFAGLGPTEIKHYAASGEGWDKAGGYAIQGNASAFVSHMRGNYTGIVGLPLYETVGLIRQAGLLTTGCSNMKA
jgi:septum formation protein